jgi:hypothetical protein
MPGGKANLGTVVVTGQQYTIEKLFEFSITKGNILLRSNCIRMHIKARETSENLITLC